MIDLGDYLAEKTPAYFAGAACRTPEVRQAIAEHTVDFFPDRPRGRWKPTRSQAAALLICGDCPVRIECVTYAADRPELKGIWGQLNETERTQFRRNRVA